VNARISNRSFPGYRRWRFPLRKVLQNVNLFLAQTQEDSRRLVEIGAPSDRVSVSGNLKFDVPVPAPPPIVAQVRSALRDSGPVLVCGSTVEGEEDLLLSAFRHALLTYPAAVMLLAPRRPERFAHVASLARQLKFEVWERSRWNGEPLAGGVLLIDTIGELAGLYALADIAFVGGSLVPSGGHSIIEPAQHGVAILVGPHTENFRDVVATFERQNAVRVVHPEEADEADGLSEAIMELLADENKRNAMGRRALQTLQAQQGATAITLQKLKTLLPTHKLKAHTS
jgi:3-deoxy-D-manno-octulosonic-acid transferase